MKIYCLLLFLLGWQISNAQLNKIGTFIPGKTTTSIIDSIAAANHIEVWETADYFELQAKRTNYSGKTSSIFELLHSCEHNDSITYSYNNPIDKDHQVFHIDYLTISDLLLSDVSLKFWRDTLFEVQFNIDGEEFMNALVSKYGKSVMGKQENKSKIINCRNGLGVTFKEEEYTITTHYKTANKNLDSWVTLSKYYTRECKPAFLQYFVLMNPSISEKIRLKEQKIEVQHEAVQNKRKKESLKDL
jgi:hypothetical protein